MDKRDIDACHRLGNGKKNTIVRFTNRKRADEVVANIKKIKTAKFGDVLPEGAKVYINSNLCPEFKKIHYKLKLLKLEGKVHGYGSDRRGAYALTGEGGQRSRIELEDEALICDRCNKWIHTKTKCNKLTKEEHQHHALNPEAPFESKTCRQCGLCYKTIAKNHKFLNYTECNSKVHIKCNKLTEKDQKYYFDNPCFSCKSCLEQNLPLQQLDDYKFRLTVDGINYPDETDPTQMLRSESQLEMLNKFNKAIDDITSDLNSDKDDDSDEIKPVDCKYYTTDELKGLKIKTDKHSSILYMNITSIQSHIEELRIILKNLNHTFDCVCIPVSKIKINTEPLVDIQIEGYQPPEGMPTYSKKGGKLIYIRNGIDYKPRLDLNMHKEKELESFFIE